MKKLCKALYIPYNSDLTTRINKDQLLITDRSEIIEIIPVSDKVAVEYFERVFTPNRNGYK